MGEVIALSCRRAGHPPCRGLGCASGQEAPVVPGLLRQKLPVGAGEGAVVSDVVLEDVVVRGDVGELHPHPRAREQSVLQPSSGVWTGG